MKVRSDHLQNSAAEVVAVVDRNGEHTSVSGNNATAEAVHDLRNILSTISMLSELALLELPPTTPICATLLQIKSACTDASDLCNQMMNPCRSVPESIQRVDLSTLVMAIAPLLTTYVRDASALQFDLNDSTPLVDVSPGGIRQVVMNLVKNAAESLGNGSGAVTVSTGSLESDTTASGKCTCDCLTCVGNCAYLAVSDTGCGMDETTRSQLFESPFTTKPDGHGLGSASIRRIINDCGGHIQVQSRVGGGTQVRLLFPQSNSRN